MSRPGRPSVLSSAIFQAAIAIVATAAAVAMLLPATRYVRDVSTSTVDNFLISGAAMLLACLAALGEAALVSRLLWGNRGGPPRDDEGELDLAAAARQIQGTAAKQAFLFLTVLVLNVVVLDRVADGALVSRSKAYRVMALLRSPTPGDREEGARASIFATGDQDLTRLLGRLLAEPTPGREWLAFAAGARLDVALADRMLHLVAEGSPRERGMAALALSRMRDPRLLGAAARALPLADAGRPDVLLALAKLGKTRETTPEELTRAAQAVIAVLAGGKASAEERVLAVWALGELEAPVALGPLEAALDPTTALPELCALLPAIGNIGAADSSPKLLALLPRLDPRAVCENRIHHDLSGQEHLVDGARPLQEKLLAAVAAIGDRRAVGELERLARDPRLSPAAQRIAAEIVWLMRQKG